MSGAQVRLTGAPCPAATWPVQQGGSGHSSVACLRQEMPRGGQVTPVGQLWLVQIAVLKGVRALPPSPSQQAGPTRDLLGVSPLPCLGHSLERGTQAPGLFRCGGPAVLPERHRWQREEEAGEVESTAGAGELVVARRVQALMRPLF